MSGVGFGWVNCRRLPVARKKGGGQGGITYRSVESEPTHRRAWLSPGWKRPGPPTTPEKVRFGPDYLADLPLWGVSWHNPPLHRELLQALCDWQDEFDDHGVERWPEDDWNLWIEKGKVLATQVRRALGPSVELDVEFLKVPDTSDA